MGALIAIYIFFKPLDIKQQVFVDVPLFELKNFTIHELDKKGLSTIMHGKNAIRYTNRYSVTNIDYTDNSQEYIANMKAKNGLYKDDIVVLTGDVKYKREDGLIFKTQKAVYNKKKNSVVSKVGYIAYMNQSVIKGSYIRYNNKKNIIFSKNINAKIQLQESK